MAQKIFPAQSGYLISPFHRSYNLRFFYTRGHMGSSWWSSSSKHHDRFSLIPSNRWWGRSTRRGWGSFLQSSSERRTPTTVMWLPWEVRPSPESPTSESSQCPSSRTRLASLQDHPPRQSTLTKSHPKRASRVMFPFLARNCVSFTQHLLMAVAQTFMNRKRWCLLFVCCICCAGLSTSSWLIMSNVSVHSSISAGVLWLNRGRSFLLWIWSVSVSHSAIKLHNCACVRE